MIAGEEEQDDLGLGLAEEGAAERLPHHAADDRDARRGPGPRGPATLPIRRGSAGSRAYATPRTNATARSQPPMLAAIAGPERRRVRPSARIARTSGDASQPSAPVSDREGGDDGRASCRPRERSRTRAATRPADGGEQEPRVAERPAGGSVNAWSSPATMAIHAASAMSASAVGSSPIAPNSAAPAAARRAGRRRRAAAAERRPQVTARSPAARRCATCRPSTARRAANPSVPGAGRLRPRPRVPHATTTTSAAASLEPAERRRERPRVAGREDEDGRSRAASSRAATRAAARTASRRGPTAARGGRGRAPPGPAPTRPAPARSASRRPCSPPP